MRRFFAILAVTAFGFHGACTAAEAGFNPFLHNIIKKDADSMNKKEKPEQAAQPVQEREPKGQEIKPVEAPARHYKMQSVQQ